MKKLLLLLLALFGLFSQSLAAPDFLLLFDRTEHPRYLVDNRYHIMVFRPTEKQCCIVSLQGKRMALDQENADAFAAPFGGHMEGGDTRHGVVLLEFNDPVLAEVFFDMICSNFLEYDPRTGTLRVWWDL